MTSRLQLALLVISRHSGQEWRYASGISTGGASYPAPISLAAVVVPTAGMAAICLSIPHLYVQIVISVL
jgi:hypothetical protein